MAARDKGKSANNPRQPSPPTTMATQILQWNCRAISTAQDMLDQHLATNRYEVLALQSLSVRPRQLPQLRGFHYPPFRVHDEKGGVRLATYVSLGLAAKEDSLPSPQPQEGYQLATTIQTQGQDIHILNCYNPTRTRDFSWLANIPNNWLVVGDFNTRDSLWEYEYPKSSAVIGEQLQDADVVLLNDGSRPDLQTEQSTARLPLTCPLFQPTWLD